MKAKYLMIAAIVIAASGLPVEGVRAQSADLSVQVAELYRQGRYREAIPIATRALQQDEAQFGIEHPSTATSLSHLASLYQSMGRYEDALPLYRRALAIREKVLGPEHPDTATSLDRLAWLYQSLGRYEDALPLYRRALAIREKVLGPEHPDTATSLDSLAWLYQSLGRYEDALPLYRRSLAIREKVLGPEHPDTATSLNSLAWLYQSQGRYDDALPLYRRALAIREKVLGPEHPDTATSLNSLAWLYQSLGRYDDALPLYRRSLAIREKVLGPEHPDTATSLDSLAWLYQSLGRYEDALPLYRRSLAIREKVLGPEHPDTAISLNSLAWLHQSMGRYDDALPLYRRSLAIREKVPGPEHPDIAKSLNSLAWLYQSMGRYDDALPLYRRAVRIVAAADISDPIREHGAIAHLALVSANLAYFLEKHAGQSSLDEAIFYYKLSVNTRQRMRAGTRGLDKAIRDSFTEKLAGPYRRLARLLIERGRIAEAERVLLLLKESELTEFLRRNGGSDQRGEQLVWAPEEEQYRRDLERVATEWREYEYRRRELDELVKGNKITANGSEVVEHDAQRNQLERRTGSIMAEATARFVEASRRANETRIKSFDSARTGLSTKLGEMQQRASGGLRTAGLVLLPDARGLTLIVTTDEGAVPLLREVSEAELNTLVSSLRTAIASQKDYRQPAEALYRHLIEPAEAQLGKQAAIRQWAILPYGSLRDLPFAALINPADGKHLIEQYALVTLTADGSGRFEGLETIPRARWQGVALGASQPDPEFGNLALPGVLREVCGVVRDQQAGPCRSGEGVVAGQRYLDAGFTPEILRRLMSPGGGAGPSFLHIATHFKAEKSLLLLGDGSKLRAADIVAWTPRLGQYDLIALSACDSGVTEAAVESLGAMFRSQGAKAVLATLWPVADVGAAPLMVEFYRQRGERQAMSKAEALRQAQLAMLGGQLQAGKPGIDLRHPYFWAPYVLMGNWL
ncbi:CHAT domain-containing tetratricopeptide repeat protein [Candidatus Accumulibacter contiguus]|jgi:CHAT domain-containing protein/Tfp pilus assembly protein PilF|uniref:CHAT domain-containing tetratricopeptide repeat protein n=1 Tax=Candidatus Accumulibacter contiguus TaxID=2954381 RepID=UPI002FC3043A